MTAEQTQAVSSLTERNPDEARLATYASQLTDAFAHYALAGAADRPQTAEALVNRLRSIERVPHDARPAVAAVLLEQLPLYVHQSEQIAGRTIAGHALDALMTLGYPWATQVDADIARQVFEAQPVRVPWSPLRTWLVAALSVTLFILVITGAVVVSLNPQLTVPELLRMLVSYMQSLW